MIKSLHDFAPDLEEGSLLCPVRALHIYLDLTKEVVLRPSSLFISPKRPSRSISKNAISFFLRQVITEAGAVGEVEGPSPRAHSVRSIATSAAFLRNWSVSKVLEAATWRSNTVFASYYFRDIAYSLEECKSLGPFVAAGNIIN